MEKVSGKVFDWRLIRRLMRYIRPYRTKFLLAFALTILLAGPGPLRPMLTQYALDHPVMEGDLPGLRNVMVLMLGLLLLEMLLTYANTYLTNLLGQQVIHDIRKEVFDHILHLRPAFFDKTPIGRLQTRTVSDIEQLSNVFSSGLVRILGDLLQIVVILVCMFFTSWRLTLLMLLIIPAMLFATRIFQKQVKAAFQSVREAVANMNAFVQEHITGMQIVHIFNREAQERESFDTINRDLRKAHLKSVLAYSVFYPVVELISALAIALLVWAGASQTLSGVATIGGLTAFIMLLNMFFRPIRMLADQINTLQMGMVSAERVFSILDTQEAIPEPVAPVEADTCGEKGHGIPISLQNVSFSYNDNGYVLRNIDLEIGAGEKVALVGATGSGKTTIISLISRFYDIQEGAILVNGLNIRDYRLETLRSMIGVVLQDVFLFSGTIRENITLSDDSIPMEKVEEAARRVGAHEFISRLPGGYDFQVRERGASLSLGQRQLIAFARVLVYDPSILVMDEATANVDTESEEQIQRAIDTVMAGRTSVIIAHRLSTVRKADRIVVLHKGEIIEQGTHTELLQARGAYYRLHELELA